MQVFCHHLYEYCKGLRNLVLHTMAAEDVALAVRKLEAAGIDHAAFPVSARRTNLFFGAAECVQVIRQIGKPKLTEYTAEEDFILGIMLGYERRRQCERYLKFKEKEGRGVRSVSQIK
ncbi:MAG: DUF2023 family protein [Kiritimatiellales bacterium]